MKQRVPLWLLGLLAIFSLVPPVLSAPLKKILVADFALSPEAATVTSGDTLAAWLTEELGSWKNVEIIPRDQLRKEITIRNLAPPLDKDQVLQIASALEADYCMWGQINYLRTLANGRKLRVMSQVEMVDVSGNIPINGANIEVDEEAPRDAAAPDPAAALRAALRQAARDMQENRMPSGQVLAVNSFGEIILNIGSQNGVKKGMRFVVTRREFDQDHQTMTTLKVGEIRVTEMGTSDATARQTTRHLVAKPLDKVQAVFDLSRTSPRRIRI